MEENAVGWLNVREIVDGLEYEGRLQIDGVDIRYTILLGKSLDSSGEDDFDEEEMLNNSAIFADSKNGLVNLSNKEKALLVGFGALGARKLFFSKQRDAARFFPYEDIKQYAQLFRKTSCFDDGEGYVWKMPVRIPRTAIASLKEKYQ